MLHVLAGLDLESGWSLVDGWSPPSLQSVQGVYLEKRPGGAQLHVRRLPQGASALTREGLTALARAQNWASPPFDVATICTSALTIVLATYDMLESDQVVIEGFLTDGRLLWNLAAPCARADHGDVRAAIESFVRCVEPAVVASDSSDPQ